MKNRRPAIIAILLILSIGNYSRIINNENVRLIQFLSIFVIGGLTVLLIREIISRFRNVPATNSNSKITGSNVTVMVQNMDQAIQFYEQIGLTVKQRWGNHYAMLIAQDIIVGLHPANGKGTGSGSASIGFMVDSADEAKALLEGLKIAYTYNDDGKSGIILNFKDLDGTMLYFMQPKWG